MIPRWLAAVEQTEIPFVLSSDRALRGAHDLLQLLRTGNHPRARLAVDDDTAEVLHALVHVLETASRLRTPEFLHDAELAYEFLSRTTWVIDHFGERDELLDSIALRAWNHCVLTGNSSEESKWFSRLPSATSSATARESEDAATRQILSSPFAERGRVLQSFDRPTVAAICQTLLSRADGDPITSRRESQFFYELLQRSAQFLEPIADPSAQRLLGRFALIAGGTSRQLSRRDDAHAWFRRAELWLLQDPQAAEDLARLAYQRLALKLEERHVAEVLRLAPMLADCFARMSVTEWVLRCRYLVAVAFKEVDRLDEALRLFAEIAREAQRVSALGLVAHATVSIIQIHCELGQADLALTATREVAPLLRRLNNRIMVAKLQWGLANLLRKQNRLSESIAAFRLTQHELRQMGLRSDVAALHLVIAELLMELRREQEAELEIRAALPIIDELKMVPEGIAALSLLRESLRRRKIDRGALSELHAYIHKQQL